MPFNILQEGEIEKESEQERINSRIAIPEQQRKKTGNKRDPTSNLS